MTDCAFHTRRLPAPTTELFAITVETTRPVLQTSSLRLQPSPLCISNSTAATNQTDFVEPGSLRNSSSVVPIPNNPFFPSHHLTMATTHPDAQSFKAKGTDTPREKERGLAPHSAAPVQHQGWMSTIKPRPETGAPQSLEILNLRLPYSLFLTKGKDTVQRLSPFGSLFASEARMPKRYIYLHSQPPRRRWFQMILPALHRTEAPSAA